jgi:hypothetical protein
MASVQEVSSNARNMVVFVQEVCVMCLLDWALAWSGAAAAKARIEDLCASVARFLEKTLMLVCHSAILHMPRNSWSALVDHEDAITAVWLEESLDKIEWTIVQNQQPEHQEMLLPLKLKLISEAINDFPQFPALRNLGEKRRARNAWCLFCFFLQTHFVSCTKINQSLFYSR